MSLFIFNNKQEVIKITPFRRLISLIQEEEINGLDILRLEIPSKNWKAVKEEPFYLGVRDHYNKNIFYMYKITKPIIKGSITEVTAIQIGFDELKGDYIKDRRFYNSSIREGLESIVEDTGWQVGFVDDFPFINTNFYYISKLEALSKLIEITGSEVRFRVEISGRKITSKRIDLYKQLSNDKGKRFAYGSKLLEVAKEEENSDIYTALVGRGKGEEILDESGEGTGNHGRKITFEDVEWTIAGGNPVDKPLGQEYVELPEMTALYGYPDGKPRIGIVDYADIEDAAELLQATYERVVETSRPKLQLKGKVANTGDMEKGETVSIIRSDLGIRYKTRVFKIKRNLLNNKYTEVELGDNLEQSMSSIIKKIERSMDRQDEELRETIRVAANGKNKVFKSEEEPATGMMVNDVWYKSVGEGEVEMYVWNGTVWELAAYSADALKGTVNAANVNVINLNANNMTTGRLSGGDSWLDLDNGNFSFGGKLRFINGEFSLSVTQEELTEISLIEEGVIYNHVKFTAEKGIEVLDAQGRQRVQLGNYTFGKYGLLLKDSTGNKTILDEDGILQTWQEGRTDNIASNNPLKLSVFIPENTRTIHQAILRIKREYFRAYSQTTSTESTRYTSTNSGGGSTGTSGSGGSGIRTSQGGGEISDNTGSGVNVVWTEPYSWGATDTSGNSVGVTPHVHKYLRVHSHEHDLSIGPHTHNVSIPSHTHSVNFPSHSHQLTISGHNHDINHGIFEYTALPSNLRLRINGTLRTSAVSGGTYINEDRDDLDITNYLVSGQWNEIEISGTGLGRIDATIFIQALMNVV